MIYAIIAMGAQRKHSPLTIRFFSSENKSNCNFEIAALWDICPQNLLPPPPPTPIP